MNFFRAIVALTVTLLLITGSECTFSKKTSKKLLDAVSRTRLGKGRLNRQLLKQAAQKVRKDFSTCSPHVCFALHGSISISERDYASQKNFVQIVTAVLGALSGSKFAAAQYGGIVNEISPMTDKLCKKKGFLNVVGKSKAVGSRITFIAPGLQYCVSQFALQAGNTNKIVLLGDGRSTFGDSGPFGPVGIAQSFRAKEGNSICAGLVGATNKASRKLFKQITGDKSKVVSVPSWDGIGDVLMTIVSEICG